MRHERTNSLQSRPKRPLAVRMLAARIAWLSGTPFWQDGRVVWRTQDAPAVAPERSDLARAQRCLYKIRQYPRAASQVLGDSASWLAENQDRLERIKKLASLCEPDIPGVVERAAGNEKQALDLLIALLPVEAVCVNSLPALPSRALILLGLHAVSGLMAFVQDTAVLPPSRVLAALVLGAIRARNISGSSMTRPAFVPGAGTERAYRWGRKNAFPVEAALVGSLLADQAGEDLAVRCLRAITPDMPLRLKSETLRRLLAQGASPATVTALAEAVAAAHPVAEQVTRYREELPGLLLPGGQIPKIPETAQALSRQRQDSAQALSVQRRQTIDMLADLYEAYALATTAPETVSLLAPCLVSLLGLGPPSAAWTDAVSDILRAGLHLPSPLIALYLTLLTESHALGIDRPTLSTQPKDPAKRQIWQAEARQKWLPARRGTAKSIRVLLRATGDEAIVREALTCGVVHTLAGCEWADPGKYRWALTLIASLPRTINAWQTHRICSIVNDLGDLAAVRVTLQPIITTLEPETPETRILVWQALLDRMGWERAARRAILPRLSPYVASLASFARQTTQPEVLDACVKGLILADRAAPDIAKPWLEALLASLLDAEAAGAETDGDTISRAARMASALTGSQPERFQALFEAARGHAGRVPMYEYKMEQGLTLLERFPGLKEPLADIFPAQPHRCIDLIVRLGQTVRLGTEALAPLERLEPQQNSVEATVYFPIPLCADNGWWQVHQLCPELDGSAASYRYARLVLDVEVTLPPGLRRALAQPERMAKELAHLDRKARTEPGSERLGGRREKLRALLADPEQLRADIRKIVRDRLPRLTAEAQIAALEQQVQNCYWARLEELAGPLADRGALTEDVINAILLAAAISKNRRLLLRLLRAHLAGETRWREEHPENIRYLNALAVRGGDVNAWQAVRPRRYPCADAAGERVHLWLERDPLHVLQMGNYFGTCLSFDDFNAFSTVANACELNKRVVYARDGAGHIVGRKLIGISEAGALVGFRTYTSLDDSDANDRLRTIFRHYLAGFADDCRLPLADDGPVPTLFAEAWYDDGTVAWEGPETVASVGSLVSATHD